MALVFFFFVSGQGESCENGNICVFLVCLFSGCMLFQFVQNYAMHIVAHFGDFMYAQSVER